MKKRMPMPTDSPSVFLSYAYENRLIANQVATSLLDAGINVWTYAGIEAGTSWIDALQDRLRASDFVVVIVSSAMLNSKSVKTEIDFANSLQELNDRSITVIPVLIEDIELPIDLKHLVYFSLRGNYEEEIRSLIRRLTSNLLIDFSYLNGEMFEFLIYDLLVGLGLEVERNISMAGVKFDFVARYPTQNPFGLLVQETWFIEAKHYSKARLSVSLIAELTEKTRRFQDRNIRFALITSSEITSAARNVLGNSHINVVGGVELKQILLQYPRIVRRYFERRQHERA